MWMIMGVGFYSFIIGNLSSIMNDIDDKNSKLQDKINALSDFARRTKLSQTTVDKICFEKHKIDFNFLAQKFFHPDSLVTNVIGEKI